MAQQEIRSGDGDGAAVATFFMNLALVVVCSMLFIDRFRPFVELWVVFGVVMAIQVAVATWMARRVSRARSMHSDYDNLDR
jgi:hypothetical protein